MSTVAKEPLQRSLDELERSLNGNISSQSGEWLTRLAGSLEGVIRAMRDHMATTESANGTLRIIEDPHQETPATLDRLADNLRLQHAQLIDGVGELQWKLHGLQNRFRDTRPVAPSPAETGLLRQAGEELLNRLREHQETERTLLLDTLNTAVGAGD